MTDKMKNILIYTSTFAAGIAAIVYILITFIVIEGFEQSIDMQKQLWFQALGAIDGLLIVSLLRSQGIALAANEPESIALNNELEELLNRSKKDKKLHSIIYYYWMSLLEDVFSKGVGMFITTSLTVYIFANGSGEYFLLLLAASNILMFAAFGVMSLVKFYSIYKDKHLAVIKERIKRLKANQKQEQEKPAQVNMSRGENNADYQFNEIPKLATTSS